MSRTHRFAGPIALALIMAVAVLAPANAEEGGNGEVTVDGVGSQLVAGKETSYPYGSGSGAGGAGSGGGGSVSGGGGVPVCGVTGVTVMLPGGDRAEYRLCRRVEPVVSVEGVPVVVSASDVSTLLVEGSGLVRQPPGDMVIVTKDLIVYTDPSSRTLSTTVGGTAVSVVVTPVSYRWDWGDGTSTTTRDPGAAYPHQTVVHRYRELLQGVVVTLTTTWSATFSVDGGPPQPVSGTVTTTESSAPFDLVRLVGVLTDDAEEAQGH